MAAVTGPEPDPQTLLPADLRTTWAVVPRASLYWLFVAGAIIGAGGALTVCGFVLGRVDLRWGFPLAVALTWVGAKVVSRIEERRVRLLRGRAEPGATADRRGMTAFPGS